MVFRTIKGIHAARCDKLHFWLLRCRLLFVGMSCIQTRVGIVPHCACSVPRIAILPGSIPSRYHRKTGRRDPITLINATMLTTQTHSTRIEGDEFAIRPIVWPIMEHSRPLHAVSSLKLHMLCTLSLSASLHCPVTVDPTIYWPSHV